MPTFERESKASQKLVEGKVQLWGRRNGSDRHPYLGSTEQTPWLPAASCPGLQPTKTTSAGWPAWRGEGDERVET